MIKENSPQNTEGTPEKLNEEHNLKTHEQGTKSNTEHESKAEVVVDDVVQTEILEEPKQSKEDNEAPKTEVKIFTMSEDQDYSEIGNDLGFDKWITNMDKSLRAEGTDFSSEIKDVRDWYKEYQETIPYIEKLNIILEDINNNTKASIQLLAAQSKIDNLIYRIHKEGDNAKNIINKIFNSYTESQAKKTKIEELEKTKELREVIEKSKNKGGSGARKITSDQVKQVLESRGEKNTVENLNELTNLLKDFQENYDFYCSGTKEGEENNIRYVYEKYRATGRNNREAKKVKGFSKLWGRLIASLPKSIDDQDKYNTFIDMTRSIRNFDLVDRKYSNKDKKQENKKKMSDLINFCENNADILDKYLTNDKNIESSVLEAFKNDPEKKFETAVTLFKTFTAGKYKTPEAKYKAQKILEEDSSFNEPLTSLPTIETLYSVVPLDRDIFETNAKLSINKDALESIISEIEVLTKSKANKNIPELEKIQKRFESIKNVLEEIGSSDDKNELKTTELKLSVLKLKNINTENLKELSDSFPIYEYILSSTEKTKEKKTEYITELIKDLKKHRENTKNTMIQNAHLDAIIEKYQKVLKSIK